MAASPTWQGHLKLSLVTCPVTLYKAVETSKRGVSFNLLTKGGDRISMKTHDPSGEEVPRTDLVKGYAIDKGLYVALTEDEIRSVRLESDGAIQIERFVAEAEIDRLYWDTPHYLVPDGELAHEPYAVIREAMREAGQVALARVVLGGRERQFALEVRGKGIVAHAIRTHAEVRPAAEFFDHLPERDVDQQMVAIAKQILKQHEGAFDPTAFVDRYQQAILALVEEKRKERGVTRASSAPAADEREVLDLMEALKRSLAGGATPPGRGETAKAKRKAAEERPTKPRKAVRRVEGERGAAPAR